MVIVLLIGKFNETSVNALNHQSYLMLIVQSALDIFYNLKPSIELFLDTEYHF